MAALHIDIETYSSVDLLKSGVYRYVQAPDFKILLLAYAFGGGPVEIIDFSSCPEASKGGLIWADIPGRVQTALTDPHTFKIAHNANFERTCLTTAFGIQTPPEQWFCTMAYALQAGLPGSLDMASKALKLEMQKQTGAILINYFSKPCKPTKANNGRTRNLPEHKPEKWDAFRAYCIQDVEVERALDQALIIYEVTDFEKRLWNLDQHINDLGVRCDTRLVNRALACDSYVTKKLTDAAKEITHLDNPNSVSQLKRWIETQIGETVTSLNKDTVQEMISTTQNPDVQKALSLRVQMAKTSTKKYVAMESAVCQDGRIRGLLQYYGANRTGRWAGRLVQVQNLPRNYLPDLDLARRTLLSGDYEMLGVLYGNTPDVLSQLVRTAFIPSVGRKFVVADFSAIEARIIAWLAGEKWRQDVFNTHGKIYEASAAQMFNIAIESVDKEMRQKGKVAELALGYQGGPGALIQMGALNMGLSETDLPDLVTAWRNSNPCIVRLWKEAEAAAKKAITDQTLVGFRHNMSFTYRNDALFIRLPSGRKLVYQNVALGVNDKGFKQIVYKGVNQTTRKWEQTETYGGKLVENITQAIARDCLAEALILLTARGYEIVMHIHDEIVIDAPVPIGGECQAETINKIETLMGRPLPWAPGLKLTASAFACDYYQKD